MLETHVRTKIQPWFDKLGLFCLQNIKPNTITAFAFIFGIAAGIAIAGNYRFYGLCFLWLSGLCDVMDGTVARLCNNSQKIGAYMDLIADRMVEAAVIIGFTIAYPEYYFAYIIFLIVLLLHFSTFLAAGALFANTGNKSMHYDHSFVERAEAFVVFSLMLLLPEYLFYSLMLFNLIIFIDACARFARVVNS